MELFGDHEAPLIEEGVRTESRPQASASTSFSLAKQNREYRSPTELAKKALPAMDATLVRSSSAIAASLATAKLDREMSAST